ncbi:substrate-binding domain-containing protein [Catenulispora yoronensis]
MRAALAGENLPVTVVEYDNVGGAFAATSHLLSLGHRRILFLGGEAASTTTVDRYAGYSKALAAYGLDVDERLCLTGSSEVYYASDKLRERLAAGPPDFTAIVAWDDLTAAKALVALRKAGVAVPEDVSVVGFNDDAIAEDVTPALTTVSIPYNELGREAVRLALHRADPASARNQHITLGTHIVLRDSVRPLIPR